jgi:hypothetical protein
MLSGHRSGYDTGGTPCGVVISRMLLGSRSLGSVEKVSDKDSHAVIGVQRYDVRVWQTSIFWHARMRW